MIASRLAIGIVAGLMGSMLVGLGLREKYGLQSALVIGLIEGFLGGIVAGTVMGLVDMASILKSSAGHLFPRHYLPTSRVKVHCSFPDSIRRRVFAFAILDIFTAGFGWTTAGLQLGVLFGLCSALLFAFGLRATHISLTDDIQAIEQLGWTSQKAWRGALVGAIAGAFCGVVTGLFFGCYDPLFIHSVDAVSLARTFCLECY